MSDNSEEGLLSSRSRSGRRSQRRWIIGGVVVALIVVGIILVAVFGGPMSGPGGSGGGDPRDSQITQCRYTKPCVAQWISGLDHFYRTVPAIGHLNFVYSCDFWTDFSANFSKLGVFPVASNPDWQAANALRNLAVSCKADPSVTTLEKFQIDQGLADVEYYLNLSSIDFYVNQYASYNYDYSWINDRIISAVELLDTLTENPDWGWCNGEVAGWRAVNPALFERTVSMWVHNLPSMMEDYLAAFQHQLSVNKTHAGITMEIQQWIWDEMFTHDFSSVCTLFTNATLAAQCASDAAAANVAMADFATFFNNTYVPACIAARPNSAPGATHVTDGDAAYEILLKYHLGFDTTPEAIYNLGVSRVLANQNDMVAAAVQYDPLLTTFALVNVAIKDTANPDLYFCNSSADVVIAFHQAIQSEISGLVNSEIGYSPRVNARIEINGSPSTYNANGNYDAKRHFWTRSYLYNIGNTTGDSDPNNCTLVVPKFSAMSTTMHESSPGHGLQVPLSQEISCQMSRYQFAPTSFVEGWGLYAETLGYKLGSATNGLYNNPIYQLGQNSDAMLRNVRLKVDSAMNGDVPSITPWTYDQGWQEMTANGFTESYARSETQRYITMSAQATAYMQGRIKIEKLRADAETALGVAFDPREFHNLLLRYGGASLANLAGLIQTWVTTKLSALPNTDASFNTLFAIDLVRQQFSPTLPVVGLGPL